MQRSHQSRFAGSQRAQGSRQAEQIVLFRRNNKTILREGLKRERKNKKGCDIGYALAADSCEGVHNVEHAPSQPLMRSPLSRFQAPANSRRLAGFFGSGSPAGCPVGLITQPTSDWQRIRKPTLSAVDASNTKFTIL